MLWVYAGADLIRCDQRARMDLPVNTIDVSKTTNIAETLLTIYAHQTPGSIIYLGYIEPILMKTLVVVGQHNVETSSPVDNGSSPHVPNQV